MVQGLINDLVRPVTKSDGVPAGDPSPKMISQVSWDDKADPESHGKANDVVPNNERELVAHVISEDDDPSLNPWTFRSFFIGFGLSAFGSALAEIYYFKPVRGPEVFISNPPQPVSTANPDRVVNVPGYYIIHYRYGDG